MRKMPSGIGILVVVALAFPLVGASPQWTDSAELTANLRAPGSRANISNRRRVRNHVCDRKGPPTKVVDESGGEPITRIYPTCSECGVPHDFDQSAYRNLTSNADNLPPGRLWADSRAMELRAPHVNLAGLPPEEREHASILAGQVTQLATHREAFRSALELFDFATFQMPGGDELLAAGDNKDEAEYDTLREKLRLFAGWQKIAGRDGATTIWNFARSVYNVNSLRRHCPTLNQRLVRRDIVRAAAMVGQYFPNRKLGDSAVPEAARIGPAIKPGELIGPTISGRTFVATVGSEAVSYELSQASLKNLIEIESALYDALRPAAADL